MIIREEWDGDILTVKPEGRLDTLSSRELEDFLQERYETARQIIMDFEKVEYISSASLRVLIQAYKAMKDKDGLLLRNVCEAVREVFTMTGYIHVLKIED